MILTNEILNKAETRKGGFTKKQLAIIGVSWPPPKGWKKKRLGDHFPEKTLRDFLGVKVLKSKEQILNPMSKPDDWAWKPQNEDVPEIKTKKGKLSKNKGKNKKKRKDLYKKDDNWFYNSRTWRELRVRVMERYDCKCMMCGRNPKTHGIVIHVDHIKPRSKHPQLSLEFSNLQLLCEDCNMGKGNKHETDWRPYSKEADEELDRTQMVEINIYT